MENLKECKQPKEILDALRGMLMTAKGFILFAGKNGTGKTYASKCVYNQAIHPLTPPSYNHDIAFFSSQAELMLRLERERKQFGEIFGFVDYIKKSKLLVLDDIGTRSPTDALRDFIYLVLDYRYNENLATIITTNNNSNELRLTFGDAFISRAASGKVFRFEGEDRRRKDF